VLRFPRNSLSGLPVGLYMGLSATPIFPEQGTLTQHSPEYGHTLDPVACQDDSSGCKLKRTADIQKLEHAPRNATSWC